jgi:hypothetical protein
MTPWFTVHFDIDPSPTPGGQLFNSIDVSVSQSVAPWGCSAWPSPQKT